MRPSRPLEVIGPWSQSRPGRSPRERCDSAQLVVQEIHQQAVVPGAVAAALVAAHDADGAEADALVAADRGRVRDGRVDRDAVMAARAEEPSRDGPDRVGAEA